MIYLLFVVIALFVVARLSGYFNSDRISDQRKARLRRAAWRRENTDGTYGWERFPTNLRL